MKTKRQPNTHDVKCFTTHFKNVENGTKRAELRIDDRDYQVGDLMVLAETTPCYYTGKLITVVITHKLKHFVGLQHGWCMLSFEVLSSNKTRRRRLESR